jgi:hypothetical protein
MNDFIFLTGGIAEAKNVEKNEYKDFYIVEFIIFCTLFNNEFFGTKCRKIGDNKK